MYFNTFKNVCIIQFKKFFQTKCLRAIIILFCLTWLNWLGNDFKIFNGTQNTVTTILYWDYDAFLKTLKIYKFTKANNFQSQFKIMRTSSLKVESKIEVYIYWNYFCWLSFPLFAGFILQTLVFDQIVNTTSDFSSLFLNIYKIDKFDAVLKRFSFSPKPEWFILIFRLHQIKCRFRSLSKKFKAHKFNWQSMILCVWSV